MFKSYKQRDREVQPLWGLTSQISHKNLTVSKAYMCPVPQKQDPLSCASLSAAKLPQHTYITHITLLYKQLKI